MNYVSFAWAASGIKQHQNCRLTATVLMELYAYSDRVVKEYFHQEKE
jgi:hypothetical protein